MGGYHHDQIEKKWQETWAKEGAFAAKEGSLPKYYVLDMFPYPSGAGLHVGHLVGYTATDVMARYKRASGFSVLHPMGWDSFGLPAEQYAIRTGTHPAVTTDINIQNFRKQLMRLGYSYDWDREFQTSDPTYYKWTQWIFTLLFERGLAYQAEMMVNWCPALGTVLANEEIEGGFSKEGGHPVERRPLRQWVLKITEYAERLLDDLEGLDWPEGLKRLQRNWIGKSEGAMVHFAVEGQKEPIVTYTTRPDTLFGVTYLVLAPEHPFVDLLTRDEERDAVEAYRKQAAHKSELERLELAKEKTGVFTGAYALHPVTKTPLPIWVADYVVWGYGTGAVQGVPAHDPRDQAFAKKFDLPIVKVIESDEECFDEEGTVIESHHGSCKLTGLSSKEAKSAIIAWLEEAKKGKGAVQYKLRDWLFSRQRYWGEPIPVVHLPDGNRRALGLDELPLLPPEIEEYKPSPSGESPLAKAQDWVEFEDEKTKTVARRETNTMPQWAGSCWYYLRFCDPHNPEAAWNRAKEEHWMPVDLYVGGAEHAVLHLLYARFWHKVLFDAGFVSHNEPFRKLVNQGLIVSRSFKERGGQYVSPDETVEKEGAYFHFETNEPLESHIEKMSKSKLNGVSPDEVIEEFGADALRLYVLFMGPIEKEKIWSTQAVSGTKRFCNRLFDLVHSEKVVDEEIPKANQLLAKVIDGVTKDLDAMLFNTAIAKMMEFLNGISSLPKVPRKALITLMKLLAPFAPHLAEELFATLGGEGRASDAPWPVADQALLVEKSATYIVQVNGKMRGRFDLPKGHGQEEILALAKQDEKITKFLDGEIVKVIFVPDKLLNIVVR